MPIVSQGRVETLFRWGGKRLHFCMINLLGTIYVKFYHSRSGFVGCISKTFRCFFHSVVFQHIQKEAISSLSSSSTLNYGWYLYWEQSYSLSAVMCFKTFVEPTVNTWKPAKHVRCFVCCGHWTFQMTIKHNELCSTDNTTAIITTNQNSLLNTVYLEIPHKQPSYNCTLPWTDSEGLAAVSWPQYRLGAIGLENRPDFDRQCVTVAQGHTRSVILYYMTFY